MPTLVPFQYNPAEVTRVLKVTPGQAGGPALRVGAAPQETYTLKIELDALGAPDKPITSTLGVGPMLAAIEAMLEPAGQSGLVGARRRGDGHGQPRRRSERAAPPLPAPSLPLVVLAWSLERIVPVRIDSPTPCTRPVSTRRCSRCRPTSTCRSSSCAQRDLSLGHDAGQT